MIKRDDGMIEYEVGDVVTDTAKYSGTVVAICQYGLPFVYFNDANTVLRCKPQDLTPANPPSEQPQRTVKQEWEYAMECAGIAAKHTTPDDLAERVFVALIGGLIDWSDDGLMSATRTALAAAKAFRDAQQAQGGGE